MTSGKAIRQAFARAVAEIDGVSEALPWEPAFLPSSAEGAVVTMMIRRAPATVVSMGPVAEVRWEWSVYVYIQLRELEIAHDELEELLPRLMLVTLADPTLDDTCDEALLVDDAEEPFYDGTDDEDGNLRPSLLVKRLRLVAVGEIAP